MADKTAVASLLPIETDDPIAVSQLSVMIDDELAQREIDWVLRRLSRDSEARDRWERYHLISDTLKGHLPDTVDPEFAARIRQLIEVETVTLPKTKPLSVWYKKPVAGVGLAASVALVALFGFQFTQTNPMLPAGSGTAMQASSATNSVLPVASTALFNPRDKHSKTPAQTRLNNYLVSHNSASLNGVPGALPSYARLVGYQTGR